MKAADLLGQRFGRLAVLKIAGRDIRGVLWACLCDCGNTIITPSGYLTSGDRRSCGCLRGVVNQKHGQTGTRLYHVWKTMKERCANHHNKKFPAYGGRGIRVCERWKTSFQNFVEDMGERPPGASIDRIDNDGHYEPSNCRWATTEEQSRNKQNTRLLTHNEVTKALSEWARDRRMLQSTISNRIDKLGWSVADAIERPTRPLKG